MSRKRTPSRKRKPYPSDLSNRKWEQIDLLLPGESALGRKRIYPLREIVNAINYRWTTGCTWRMLPHDLPPWSAVYPYQRRWQNRGLLSEIRRIILQPERRFRDRSRARAPEIPRESNPFSPAETSERKRERK